MNLSSPLEDLLGQSAARVLRRLSLVSDGLSGRRIAELADVPTATASRTLANLVEIGLVTGNDVGRSRLYRLNRDHVLWEAIETMLSSPSRLEAIAVESVRGIVGDRATVAAFGSFARGEAGSRSDIDLLVVWDESVDDDEHSRAMDSLVTNVKRASGNRVEVVDLRRDDLRRLVRAADPLVASWSRDARTLSGNSLTQLLEEVAG